MSKHNSATDNWTVYIHTVPKEITGYDYDKYYVGITKVNPKERWQGGAGYKGQIFHKAIKKYGWDNIRHQVIARYLSAEDAVSLEKSLILLYDSLNGHHGYNVTAGGDGFNGFEMADSTVEKLRSISKNKWNDDEYVKNVTNNLKRGKDNPRSRSVVLLNTKEVFTTETEAMNKYGLASPTQFINFCNGRMNCEKKDELGRCLTWVWYENYIQMSEEDIEKKINNSTRYLNRRPLKKEIVCLNTRKKYTYGFEIVEEYNLLNPDGVYLCCRNRHLWAGETDKGERLVWAFVDDYNKMTQEDIESKINKANGFYPNKTYSISIIDQLTNTIYLSIRDCSRNTGISRDEIKKSINGDSLLYQNRFKTIDKEK